MHSATSCTTCATPLITTRTHPSSSLPPLPSFQDKDKLADKLEAEDKEKIEEAVKEALSWLDDNQAADKDEFAEKLKEVEAICNPIVSKVYAAEGGGAGAGGGAGGAGGEEDLGDHDEL